MWLTLLQCLWQHLVTREHILNKRAFCTTLHVQLSFNILHLFCPQMLLFFYTLPKVSTLAGSICVSGIPCFETNTSIRFYMLLIFLLYVICP